MRRSVSQASGAQLANPPHRDAIWGRPAPTELNKAAPLSGAGDSRPRGAAGVCGRAPSGFLAQTVRSQISFRMRPGKYQIYFNVLFGSTSQTPKARSKRAQLAAWPRPKPMNYDQPASQPAECTAHCPMYNVQCAVCSLQSAAHSLS